MQLSEKMSTGELSASPFVMLHAMRTLMAAGLLLFMSNAAAQEFALEDIQGKTHRLADYRGKWVLVNFWATWCPPCLNEIPELIGLHDAHKDKDLLVIGIAMDSGSRGKVAEFAKAHSMSYPIVMGNRKIMKQIGEVEGLPASYLYNPQGKLVSYQTGEVTRAAVEAYMLKNASTR